MASIPLDASSLRAVKHALRSEFPDVCSSHLSESLAAALRRRTHAALVAELADYRNDPPIEALDEELFDQRLQTLGHVPDPGFTFEYLTDCSLISTRDPRAYDIAYRTPRDRAWRNLLVCAINEGLRQRLFTLRCDDNRWPNADTLGQSFDFLLPNQLPARAHVRDIHYGELSLHVAVNPRGDWVEVGNAGFAAGDAFAAGWLERKRGAWLQSATTQLHCRKRLLYELAEMTPRPCGFGDRGRVIL